MIVFLRKLVICWLNSVNIRPAATLVTHDDVIKWKHFPRYWPFVRGIHRSPVNYPHKGHWRGALMFSLICAWINGWVSNREAGHLKRYRAHYDVIVMTRAGATASPHMVLSWICVVWETEKHNITCTVSQITGKSTVKFTSLFRLTPRKTHTLCITSLCERKSLMPGVLHSQRPVRLRAVPCHDVLIIS